MTRHVKHTSRAQRTFTFFRILHACGHWESHLLWTNTAEKEQEAIAESESLTQQECSNCKSGKGQE